MEKGLWTKISVIRVLRRPIFHNIVWNQVLIFLCNVNIIRLGLIGYHGKVKAFVWSVLHSVFASSARAICINENKKFVRSAYLRYKFASFLYIKHSNEYKPDIYRSSHICYQNKFLLPHECFHDELAAHITGSPRIAFQTGDIQNIFF